MHAWNSVNLGSVCRGAKHLCRGMGHWRLQNVYIIITVWNAHLRSLGGFVGPERRRSAVAPKLTIRFSGKYSQCDSFTKFLTAHHLTLPTLTIIKPSVPCSEVGATYPCQRTELYERKANEETRCTKIFSLLQEAMAVHASPSSSASARHLYNGLICDIEEAGEKLSRQIRKKIVII